MKLEWAIARRYLLSRERNALISVNTLISVLGVAVGVAALVVVLGVMDGAYRLMERQITNITPHVRLVPLRAGLATPPGLLEALRRRPEVTRVDPVVNKQALIQLPRGSEAQKQGIQLFGLDRVGPEKAGGAGEPAEGAAGAFTFNFPPGFKPAEIGPGQIALGKSLAAKLNAAPGSVVQLLTQTPRRAGTGLPFRLSSYRVAAVLDTGYYDFDSRTAFISNAAMAQLFPQTGPDYISIRLREPGAAGAFRKSLALEDYSARTWQDESGDFFASLKVQKYGLFIILSMIILVSALNIIGTLILMTREKTRQIGILRAVGASRGFIGRVFLFIGMLIGLAGAGLGLGLGVGAALLVPYVPIKMPEAIYNFDRLPMDIRPATLVSIAATAFLICALGALIPALQAARLKPAQAVRCD